MNYEDLLMEAEAEGLIVKEKPLKVSDGRIKGKRIAIRQDIPTYRQKSCVLAEELGHHHTTVGRILEQDSVMDRKQERRARMWAYDKRIGLSGIIDGYRKNCRNLHELAEHLDVTEEFLAEALERYREKYGAFVRLDGYVIMFEPCLAVIELII